jgi:hypothetical protein
MLQLHHRFLLGVWKPDHGRSQRLVKDSRIGHARALIDDARTILFEMSKEIIDENLQAARLSLNVAIKNLNILEAS